MRKPTPTATARYSRHVVVEFDSATDAKEFFYQLGEQMGHDPRNRKYPPGTGLEWALPHLSKKHTNKLTRARQSFNAALGPRPPTGGDGRRRRRM